jgi:hypothetical protein
MHIKESLKVKKRGEEKEKREETLNFCAQNPQPPHPSCAKAFLTLAWAATIASPTGVHRSVFIMVQHVFIAANIRHRQATFTLKTGTPNYIFLHHIYTYFKILV